MRCSRSAGVFVVQRNGLMQRVSAAQGELRSRLQSPPSKHNAKPTHPLDLPQPRVNRRDPLWLRARHHHPVLDVCGQVSGLLWVCLLGGCVCLGVFWGCGVAATDRKIHRLSVSLTLFQQPSMPSTPPAPPPRNQVCGFGVRSLLLQDQERVHHRVRWLRVEAGNWKGGAK